MFVEVAYFRPTYHLCLILPQAREEERENRSPVVHVRQMRVRCSAANGVTLTVGPQLQLVEVREGLEVTGKVAAVED
jgi:hypothetical protein